MSAEYRAPAPEELTPLERAARIYLFRNSDYFLPGKTQMYSYRTAYEMIHGPVLLSVPTWQLMSVNYSYHKREEYRRGCCHSQRGYITEADKRHAATYKHIAGRFAVEVKDLRRRVREIRTVYRVKTRLLET